MAVVVRYQSLAANAVLTHRFESVATCSSQAGDGSLLSKVMRVPSRAPFGSISFRIGGVFSAPFDRWQRVVRYSRCTNFCRPLVGWSFGALAQACKQSSRRFTYRLHSFASVFAHVEQHGANNVEKIRKGIGNELC